MGANTDVDKDEIKDRCILRVKRKCFTPCQPKISTFHFTNTYYLRLSTKHVTNIEKCKHETLTTLHLIKLLQ